MDTALKENTFFPHLGAHTPHNPLKKPICEQSSALSSLPSSVSALGGPTPRAKAHRANAGGTPVPKARRALGDITNTRGKGAGPTRGKKDAGATARKKTGKDKEAVGAKFEVFREGITDAVVSEKVSKEVEESEFTVPRDENGNVEEVECVPARLEVDIWDDVMAPAVPPVLVELEKMNLPLGLFRNGGVFGNGESVVGGFTYCAGLIGDGDIGGSTLGGHQQELLDLVEMPPTPRIVEKEDKLDDLAGLGIEEPAAWSYFDTPLPEINHELL